MTEAERARVIVVGNEKGGTGKSTVAMHVIVALMRLGHTVASIDLDVRQQSLTRYIENRRGRTTEANGGLPIPAHGTFDADTDPDDGAQEQRLTSILRGFSASHEVVVVDTPGNTSGLTRSAHAYADILITPINDSFIDLDVLGRVNGDEVRVERPSHYAEMVWEQKKRRAARDGQSLEWIVLKNRLSSLDARNKRRVDGVLAEMAGRFGFRLAAGFGERVIYRELFPVGLTLLDLASEEAGGDGGLTLSQVAARQEVRALVEALRLPPPRARVEAATPTPISRVMNWLRGH